MDLHLATPPGLGGIAALWLTGTPAELAAVDRQIVGKPLPAGAVARGTVRDKTGLLDEVLLAAVAGRRILTGHGGTATALALLNHFIARGARETDAAPGMWAATNAVQTAVDTLLPSCRTETQAALLLTCREALSPVLAQTRDIDDLRARLVFAQNLLRPRTVAILGKPNAGKSSLLNRLTGEQRALVHAAPGTTRDPVAARVDIGGYDVALVDTAGFRDESDALEKAAQDRAGIAAARAEATVLVLDRARALSAEDEAAAARCRGRPAVIVLNKRDLPAQVSPDAARALLPDAPIREFSCLADEPATLLRPLLTEALGGAWDGRPHPFLSAQLERETDAS